MIKYELHIASMTDSDHEQERSHLTGHLRHGGGEGLPLLLSIEKTAKGLVSIKRKISTHRRDWGQSYCAHLSDCKDFEGLIKARVWPRVVRISLNPRLVPVSISRPAYVIRHMGCKLLHRRGEIDNHFSTMQ